MCQKFKLKQNKPHPAALTHLALIPGDHFSPHPSSPGVKAAEDEDDGCRVFPKHALPLPWHGDVPRVLPWPELPCPSWSIPSSCPEPSGSSLQPGGDSTGLARRKNPTRAMPGEKRDPGVAGLGERSSQQTSKDQF